MTGLIAIHKDAIPTITAMLPVWQATLDHIIWVVNPHEVYPRWFPDGPYFIPDGSGRDGLSSIQKLHSVLRYAHTLNTDIALLEYDSTLLTKAPHAPIPKASLFGSQLFTANPIMGDKGYLARRFMHSPYLLSHTAIGIILETLDQWQTPDGGYYWIEKGMGDVCVSDGPGWSLTMKGTMQNTINEDLAKLPTEEKRKFMDAFAEGLARAGMRRGSARSISLRGRTLPKLECGICGTIHTVEEVLEKQKCTVCENAGPESEWNEYPPNNKLTQSADDTAKPKEQK